MEDKHLPRDNNYDSINKLTEDTSLEIVDIKNETTRLSLLTEKIENIVNFIKSVYINIKFKNKIGGTNYE